MSKSKVSYYSLPTSPRQQERITGALALLQLDGILGTYETIAERVSQTNGTLHDFLERLLEQQLSWKEEHRLKSWIQQGRFPVEKTLDMFDFSFQPSIDERLIRDLASCRFIDRKDNIIFLGPPGVGKTHLAISLAFEAIYKGYEARFLTLDKLIDLVGKAAKAEDDRLVHLSAALLRPKLLILDEMDLYETDETTSNFLFKLLQQRYEKGSTIFTSNTSFVEWGELFGNKKRASAIIDRVLHHGIIITIEGESYRVKEIKENLKAPKKSKNN